MSESDDFFELLDAAFYAGITKGLAALGTLVSVGGAGESIVRGDVSGSIILLGATAIMGTATKHFAGEHNKYQDKIDARYELDVDNRGEL